MLLALKRWAARKWLYRKLDKIGMPRSESRPLVEYVVATQFPSKKGDVSAVDHDSLSRM